MKPRLLVIFYLLLPLTPLMLKALGFTFLAVFTDSMEPTVPRGSLVVAAPTWLIKPRIGDIIAYELTINNRTVIILHRIVGIHGTHCLTKGDNRQFIDPWLVKEDDVIGVAIFVAPLVGLILYYVFPVAASIAAGIAAYTVVKWFVSRRGV